MSYRADIHGILVLLSMPLIGALLLICLSQWGIGASPDSAVYLGVAASWQQGLGLTIPFGETIPTPLIHHAPLYPLLLGLLPIEVTVAARWLNIVLFAVNIFLAVLILWRQAGLPIWSSLFAGLLILTAPWLLNLHLMAWTEPLFVALTLVGLLALADFLKEDHYWRLIVAAIAIGLAVLTRYAGLAWLLTSVIALFLFGSSARPKRLVTAIGFGLITMSPLAIWILRNQFVAGSATNRFLTFHPIGLEHLQQAIGTIASWLLLPQGVPGVVKLSIIAVVILGLLALGLRTEEHAGASQWWESLLSAPLIIKLLAISIIVYGFFLSLSISFLDANTPLDHRILAPVYTAGAILVSYQIGYYYMAGKALRWLPHLLLILGLVGYGWQSWRLYEEIEQRQGLGFYQASWQESETIAYLRRLEANQLVFSNIPEVVYLHTGHPARSLPRPYNPVTQRSNEAYALEMEQLRERLEDGGYLILFHLRTETSPTARAAIANALAVCPLREFSDGTVYASPTCQ